MTLYQILRFYKIKLVSCCKYLVHGWAEHHPPCPAPAISDMIRSVDDECPYSLSPGVTSRVSGSLSLKIPVGGVGGPMAQGPNPNNLHIIDMYYEETDGDGVWPKYQPQ